MSPLLGFGLRSESFSYEDSSLTCIYQDFLLTRYCHVFNMTCSQDGCGINDPCKQGQEVIRVKTEECSYKDDLTERMLVIYWFLQRSGAV